MLERFRGLAKHSLVIHFLIQPIQLIVHHRLTIWRCIARVTAIVVT
jgi:hypothetical protein